jgi:hypothetical protein
MSHLNRHHFHVVIRSALPLLVVACCTVAATRPGIGFWATPGSEETRLVSGPIEEVAAIRHRLEAKDNLGLEVACGRLTLVEAAARFRDLDEQPPRFSWEDFRRSHPGATEEERYCREVIKFVGRMLEARGVTDSPIVSRLEQELQAHLERGDLRLSEGG